MTRRAVSISPCIEGKLEPEARQALVGEGKALKDQLAAVEGDLNALEVELQREAGGVLRNSTWPTSNLLLLFFLRMSVWATP